tara:strand:+ start:939 stop:2888 length:1950 start_codon:yes stop_codon:yes gene_type:complete
MPAEKIISVKLDSAKAVDGIKKIAKEEKKQAAARKKQLEDQEKEQQDLIDSMGLFGVSVGGLKKNFQALKVASSLTFKSMKAGLIATGIGAFVVAIGSLTAYFTQTKRGAELLETALAGMGAVVSVIIDRFSALGELIINGVKLWLSPIKAVGKALKGDFKGALDTVQKSFKDVKESGEKAFKGIGTEIKKEIKLMTELKKASIALRDSQRELNVETAKQRAEVEALKLIAEDRTKTEEERLEAAEQAFQIEQELLDKRVANAAEAVRIQQEEMAASENTAEDLDKLAELEIALFNIQQESGTKQIELNNKINAIKQETINKIKQEEQAELDKIAAVEAAEEKANADRAKNNQEFTDKVLNRNMSATEKEIQDIKNTYQEKYDLLQQQIDSESILIGEALSIRNELESEEARKIKEINDAVIQGQIDKEMDLYGGEMREQLIQAAERANFDMSEIRRDGAAKSGYWTNQALKDFIDSENIQVKITKVTSKEKVDAAKGVLGAMQGLFKEGTAGAKASAMAQILIDTATGISSAIAGATAAAAGTGPAAIFTQPVFLAQMIATVLTGIANAKATLGKVAGGGGGGSSANVSVPSGGGMRTGTSTLPNMELIGNTQLGQDTPVEPMKAFVVENDISSSQALQEELETQATL